MSARVLKMQELSKPSFNVCSVGFHSHDYGDHFDGAASVKGVHMPTQTVLWINHVA